MSSEVGEYKGHPTITLMDAENEDFKMTFGVRKAKLILVHWDDIQRFVGGEKHQPQQKDDF
jgi:hypothetical protein